jgi:hypothetical protein
VTTPEELNAVQHGCLDALREQLPALKTSEILAFIMNADLFIDRLQLKFDDDSDELVLARALVMLSEELDQRIPARDGPKQPRNWGGRKVPQ